MKRTILAATAAMLAAASPAAAQHEQHGAQSPPAQGAHQMPDMGAMHARHMATERNREIVTRFVNLFCGHHVREAFMTYVSPGYIQHNPLAADGRDAAIAALEPFFASQPNLRCEIQRILVDGDLAAVHYRLRMNETDRGAAVVDILRLENGMIVEHWDVFQPVPEHSNNPHPMF